MNGECGVAELEKVWVTKNCTLRTPFSRGTFWVGQATVGVK